VSTIVDLSHSLRDGAPAYPGLPSFRVVSHVDREASRARYGGRAEFLMTGYDFDGATGTYLDSPFHRFADGTDLAGLPLGSCVGLEGVVVDGDRVPGRACAMPARDPGELEGRAVLFRTGWDSRRGSDGYWKDAPYLPAETVAALVAARAALVGVDFGNVDDTDDPTRPAHTGLLGAGIPLVENLTNLAALPGAGFRFTAAPLAIHGGANVPVRAFAEIP
jgi:kynurenine formamidase